MNYNIYLRKSATCCLFISPGRKASSMVISARLLTDPCSICHQPGTRRGDPGPEVSPHVHSYLQGQAIPKGSSQEPAQCPRTQGRSMALWAKSVQNSSACKEVGYDEEEIPLGQALSASPAYSSFGRGWCPAARTRTPSSTCSRGSSWQAGMSVWMGTRHPGDGQEPPPAPHRDCWHWDRDPSLGTGHGQGIGWLQAWSGAANPIQATPASPRLRRFSFLGSHIPLRVFMAFLSSRCPRLKSPLLREPQDHGLLELCRLLLCKISPHLLERHPCLALPCFFF